MSGDAEREVRRHELLLLLSSLLPDDVAWQARAWFAAGQWSHAVRVIVQVFQEWGERLPAGSAEILADGADGRIAARVGEIGETSDRPVPSWRFLPAEEVDARLAEECADIVRSYLETVPGVQTAWQAGRFLGSGLPESGRLLHLVEIEDGAEPKELAAELAQRLWHVGVPSPQVEVFRTDMELDTYYHLPALAAGKEIHADGPAPVIELALFDETEQRREPEGPQRDALLTYLSSGETLTDDDDFAPDLFAGSDEPVVPLVLRTDGRWIWSDANAYYLAQYGIVLPDRMRDHIAEAGPTARTPTRREWVAMVRLEETQTETLSGTDTAPAPNDEHLRLPSSGVGTSSPDG